MQSISEVEDLYWPIFTVILVLAAVLSLYYWGLMGALFTLLGSVSLAAEFKLIVWMAGLFTRTLIVHPLAVVGIFLGKIGVWLFLCSAPFWMPHDMSWAFALGCFTMVVSLFLLAVVLVRKTPQLSPEVAANLRAD